MKNVYDARYDFSSEINKNCFIFGLKAGELRELTIHNFAISLLNAL